MKQLSTKFCTILSKDKAFLDGLSLAHLPPNAVTSNKNLSRRNISSTSVTALKILSLTFALV